jgi:hypothetical protein
MRGIKIIRKTIRSIKKKIDGRRGWTKKKTKKTVLDFF